MSGNKVLFFLWAGLKDFIYIYLYIDSFGLHFQLVCAWFIADLKDSISIFLMCIRQDLSKGLRFQVEALVGLRELSAVPEAERLEILNNDLSWVDFF